MAKVNVNSASRDELVEAGVKPELAEEILKLRRKGRIESIEAFTALPGVGPVTLEQLRKGLDFGDKAVQEGERAVRETTEKAADAAGKVADAAGAALREGAEATRSTADAGTRVASIAVRSGLQTVQRTAGAVAEVERATARRAAEGTTELSQVFVDLLNEQTRHNLQTMTALTQAVDWERVVRVQSEFMRVSLQRMGELTRRYFEVSQAGLTTATSAARDQVKKAA